MDRHDRIVDPNLLEQLQEARERRRRSEGGVAGELVSVNTEPYTNGLEELQPGDIPRPDEPFHDA